MSFKVGVSRCATHDSVRLGLATSALLRAGDFLEHNEVWLRFGYCTDQCVYSEDSLQSIPEGKFISLPGLFAKDPLGTPGMSGSGPRNSSLRLAQRLRSMFIAVT
jgi:hypothetical protein